MKRALWVAMLAAVLVLVTGVWAGEEEGEKKPLYRVVHYDKVDPAKTEVFEAKSKEWVAAFAEKGMGSEWYWFTAAGPEFVYVTVFPFSAYADLDEDYEKRMAEALGEEKLKALNEPTGAVLSHYSSVIKHLPELSYWPEAGMAEDPGFLHVGVHWVRPGMEEDFKALAEKVLAACKKVKAPLGYNAWQVEYGEGTYLFSTAGKDPVEVYGSPGTGKILTEAFGAEEAEKVFAEWRGCVTNYDEINYSIRADLSYMGPPPEEKE
jgi:hypothetical protein